MTADEGSDERAERDDGEVLRARVCESGMGQRVGDALVSEGRRHLGVDEDDSPGGTPVLEYGAHPIAPRMKLLRSGVVLDDDVVWILSRHARLTSA